LNVKYFNTKNIQSEIVNNYEINKVLIVFFGFLAVLNPMSAVITSFIYLLSKKNESESNYFIFFITLCTWISLVNMGKIPSSDQIVYTRMFYEVPRSGFYGTMFESSYCSRHESVYRFIVWVGYYLALGNSKFFFFMISFTIYMLHYLATYKVLKHIGASKLAILCGVLSLTFFTQYFVMTLQLIRQMLGTAIIIYAIAQRAVTGRNAWWWLLAGCLTHTSSMFLATLSLIPWFYRKLTGRRLWICIGVVTFVLLFGDIIAGLLAGSTQIDLFNYAMERMSTKQDDGLGAMKQSIMMTIFIPLMIVVTKLLLTNDYTNEVIIENGKMERTSAIYPFIYIGIFTMLYVLSMTGSPLIQYRFFYFSYSFIPFLLPLLLKPGRLWESPYFVVVSLFFIIRFFMLYDDMTWKYPPLVDVLLIPMPYYFIQEFYHFNFMP